MKRNGFTLIEIITTLTIVGAMLSIALPYLKVSPEKHVRDAVHQIARDLEVARTRALSSGKMTRMDFNVAAKEYQGYLDIDDDGVFNEDIAERVALGGQKRTLYARVQFSQGSAPAAPGETGTGPVTFTGDQLDFEARGLPTPFGTRGTVYVSHVDNSAVVGAVTTTGSGAFKVWIYKGGVWQ